MMRMFSRINILAAACVGVASCSSVQLAPEPDMQKLAHHDETIFILTRPSTFYGNGGSPDIYADGVKIGEIGFNGRLAWSAEVGKPVCLSAAGGINALIPDLTETPISYSCFPTKGGETINIIFHNDGGYFTKNTGGIKPFGNAFKVGQTRITGKIESSFDVASLLEAELKKALTKNGASLSNSPQREGIVIDLEVAEYNAGNAGLRYLGESAEGSSVVTVLMTINQNNTPIETFKIKRVISIGGLLSVGGDKTVISDAAKLLAEYLYPME